MSLNDARKRASGWADGDKLTAAQGITMEEAERLAKLASAAPEMARVLLAIEWGGYDEDGSKCPTCHAPAHVPPLRYDANGKYIGYTQGAHASDCALDAALRKAGVR